jgi:hypothetical protein
MTAATSWWTATPSSGIRVAPGIPTKDVPPCTEGEQVGWAREGGDQVVAALIWRTLARVAMLLVVWHTGGSRQALPRPGQQSSP